MSNLLSIKSKYLLGVMIVAIIVAGALFAFALTASAAYTHMGTLRVGSSGAQVMSLQTALGGLVADGSFGPMTKAAVMSFQSSNGLTADGVVGPMTGAALAGSGQVASGCQAGWLFNPVTGASCSTGASTVPGCLPGYMYAPLTGLSCSGGVTPPVSGGPLTGGAGSVDSYDLASGLSNEEVGEDADDVKVVGLEIENSDDSDIQLTALRLVFDEGTAARL